MTNSMEATRMNYVEFINSRHSYRGPYKPTPVPREHLTAIMQAGLNAPSGCNKQTTSLIGVDDPAVIARMREVMDLPVAPTAPAYIVVMTQHIEAKPGRYYSEQDYAAAIENMLLAMVALGYQSCWYEGQVTDEAGIGHQMAQVLGVPDDYELVCFLPVGVAKTVPVSPKKKPFDERAWFNAFPASDR